MGEGRAQDGPEEMAWLAPVRAGVARVAGAAKAGAVTAAPTNDISEGPGTSREPRRPDPDERRELSGDQLREATSSPQAPRRLQGKYQSH